LEGIATALSQHFNDIGMAPARMRTGRARPSIASHWPSRLVLDAGRAAKVRAKANTFPGIQRDEQCMTGLADVVVVLVDDGDLYVGFGIETT